jgi:putative DNA methylase
MTQPKKLIEVALPLAAINAASAREKSIRHGHPSTLHLWWARRPLAAARAVIFAQLVDDPSSHPELFPTAAAQEEERQRLFRLIEQLVLWENTTNENVLQQARAEIWQSWRRTCAAHANDPRAAELYNPDKLPAFHDPFAGGGSLPLEAQRLGLESYASDLNPVAVLINKAMIEIPPKFANRPPVNPGSAAIPGGKRAARDGGAPGAPRLLPQEWRGAQGLAEDVRYYGQWMRNEAEKRIGHLYPKITVTPEMAQTRPDLQPLVGQSLTVIAWLWARTVKSPNPAFAQVAVPLASTFMLSTKPGKEAYVEPVLTGDAARDGSVPGYYFTVKVGKPKNMEAAKNGTKSGGSGSSFLCLMSDAPMQFEYLRDEAKAGRMGARLMAIVAEGERGRVYLSPTLEMEAIAHSAQPQDVPETELPKKALGFRIQEYGMTKWRDLFTSRQLVALTTFSDLVQEAWAQVLAHAQASGLPADECGIDAGGVGATAYADAVAVYLGFCIDKGTLTNTTQATWQKDPDRLTQAFSRQAIPMTWDYAEANPLSEAGGGIGITANAIAKVLERLPQNVGAGFASQKDAASDGKSPKSPLISTDPPYYDNIGYADLADYFYIWLRRSLRSLFPDLFATVAVPKAEELVATPYRHGSKLEAEAFFLEGMTRAMHRLAEQTHPAFPVTIYYAFKQSENETDSGSASTGWETFLDAVIKAGFALTGTWPMRTELLGNLKKTVNALASSIVLVCRPRLGNAPTASRREFITALKAELPIALTHLQRGNIAPVDLAQAAIGPGMAVYTRYARVLDAAGNPLTVREALALINQTLDEALAEQEGDFDADSRWALSWFEQFGFNDGPYGEAETLSKAKNTSVGGLVTAGILTSSQGKVRLLAPSQLPATWDPTTDPRLTAWEAVHHLIRVLEAHGEAAAADLVGKLGSRAEIARELAYRLYTLCERKKRAAQALSYNGLVQSWPEILRLAQAGGQPPPVQSGLFAQGEDDEERRSAPPA